MVTTDSPAIDPSYVARMDRTAALSELPEPYAQALILEAAGHDEAAIAARIDVPVDAIATLLEVGRVKLSALLTADTDEREEPASELGVRDQLGS